MHTTSTSEGGALGDFSPSMLMAPEVLLAPQQVPLVPPSPVFKGNMVGETTLVAVMQCDVDSAEGPFSSATRVGTALGDVTQCMGLGLGNCADCKAKRAGLTESAQGGYDAGKASTRLRRRKNVPRRAPVLRADGTTTGPGITFQILSAGVARTVHRAFAEKRRPKPKRVPKNKRRLLSKLDVDSGSEGASDGGTQKKSGRAEKKRCVCCNTRSTPLWRFILTRPNRVGQTLCNSCGIRFKKFDVICCNCSHVPGKFEHKQSTCPHCQQPYGDQTPLDE
eukprot:m.35970 g.35970  ORF g.35970 m.35970 type:complete len:279 (+) comp7516_c0_seq1:761-1597(+)